MQAFGADRTLVVRPGLIGERRRSLDRSGYWPLRFARSAAHRTAGTRAHEPDLATEVIDVRDLAAWIVAAAETKISGTSNALGESFPLSRHLEIAREVAGHNGPLVKASSAWLRAHGVEPWMGGAHLSPPRLPLPDTPVSVRDDRAARARGLQNRPLAQTLSDTLAWERTRTPPATRRARPHQFRRTALEELKA